MYNAKPLIATALSTDSQLLALVSKVRMFDGIASFTGEPVYPYITYAEIANIEALHTDNEERESEVTFRFNVFHTASTSTIAGHINRIIKSIGFGRNYAQDMNEVLPDEKKINHKIMSYTGIFTI